jgi:hypothetical protein
MNRTMNSLDDLTLIQRFVEGKASLECNPNLRVESTQDTIQLSTKKGAFLAAVKLAINVRSAFVRQESQYRDLISQILVEHSFMPMGVTEQGLMRYEHHAIPSGYEMKYTEARSLWKSWRTQLHSRSAQSVQRLLIHTPNGWQSVHNIHVSQELIFVETLADRQANELMFHGGDRIVWLSPVEAEPKTQIFAHASLTEQPSAIVSDSLQILSSLIQMRDGKLYIQTAQGNIVIEGSDLRVHLQTDTAKSERMQLIQSSASI